MNLHYAVDEVKLLKDKYFTGFKQISYIVYLESRCTGIKWIVLANRELGDNITVFYKLKTERMYNRFSDFNGYETMEEAIDAMKEYDAGCIFDKDVPLKNKEGRIYWLYKGIKSFVSYLIYPDVRSSNVS